MVVDRQRGGGAGGVGGSGGSSRDEIRLAAVKNDGRSWSDEFDERGVVRIAVDGAIRFAGRDGQDIRFRSVNRERGAFVIAGRGHEQYSLAARLRQNRIQKRAVAIAAAADVD